MTNRFRDKTFVVTGAARGIGEASALRLLQEGAIVYLCDIEPISPVADSLANFGDRLKPYVIDVTSTTQWAELASAISSTSGKLDGLVNNAGILDASDIATLDIARHRQVLDVNLNGALLGSLALAPLLEQASPSAIINMASTMGLFGTRSSIPYSTAKAGLINLTRCLAVDLSPKGIIANAIAPGFIETRMSRLRDGSSEYATDEFQDVFMKHGKLPAGRTGTPEDIAGVVAFLLSEDARYINGQVIVVDGGVTATY